MVKERRVRNTLEKVYALPDQNLLFTVEDPKNAQPEDYIRWFTQYLRLMLGYYVRYVQQGDIDFARDKVIFHSFPIYLSQAERQEISAAINEALRPHLKNESSPERRRSIFGLLSLPDTVGTPLPAESQSGAAAIASTDQSQAE